MHSEIFRFIKRYQKNPLLVNRLIINLYLDINNIKVQNNKLIKEQCIEPGNKEREIYERLSDLFKKYEEIFNFAKLIELFENAFPPHEKEVNGIVYTPKFIKSFIIDEIFKRLETPIHQATFADISCGCGGFLYTVAKNLRKLTGKSYYEIYKQNIFGLDINKHSVERAKILLSLLAIVEGEDIQNFEFNLFVGNALEFDWFNNCTFIAKRRGFDAILGNPPYVALRNIDKESRKLLAKWSVTGKGNTDLYIPFFEIGLKFLKQRGLLGYITVNTFFRSLNARMLRKYFHNKSYDMKIIDFGNEQIFGSKSTYTCICFIQKRKSDIIRYSKATSNQIKEIDKLNFTEIQYTSLDYLRGWLLSSENAIQKIKQIESTGIMLNKRYKIRTGLATLANHIYIFKPIKEDDTFYYLKTNDTIYPIEKKICQNIINPNKIKCESDIFVNMEKIIFPYFRYENKVELFEEDYLKSHFYYAYKYLKINKNALAKRDKGNGKYIYWYAFGRTQSLNNRGYKLLFPHITTQARFIFTDQKELLFYNGNAFISNSKEDLLLLKKILESKIFNFYINIASRPYNNGYFSLSKNYIKYFGICDLSAYDKTFLLSCNDKEEINLFLQKKYNLNI